MLILYPFHPIVFSWFLSRKKMAKFVNKWNILCSGFLVYIEMITVPKLKKLRSLQLNTSTSSTDADMFWLNIELQGQLNAFLS